MTIYIYEHTSQITRGLTNQLICLISAIQYICKESDLYDEIKHVVAIGPFYPDFGKNDQMSFFDVVDMSIFEYHFPGMYFIDYFKRNNNIYHGEISLQRILQEQKNFPCKIYYDNDKVAFVWTNGKVKRVGSGCTWQLDCPILKSIMKHLQFKIPFRPMPDLNHCINNEPNLKIHLLHLRNEPDAIDWWSKQNHMTKTAFSNVLNDKYLQCVRKYIPINEILLILTAQPLNNQVIDCLKREGYQIFCQMHETNQREINAIQDLQFAQMYARNGIFIGCKKGSTFSACLLQSRISFLKSVHIDLDRIHDDEIIVKD